MALKGFLRGFFREAFGLLAVVGGIGASVLFGEALGQEAVLRWGVSPWVGRVGAHGVLFLGLYLGFQAVGYGLHRLGRVVFLGGLDRLAGALLGVLTGVLLAGAGALAVAEVSWARGWLEGSVLAEPLRAAFLRAAAWLQGGGR